MQCAVVMRVIMMTDIQIPFRVFVNAKIKKGILIVRPGAKFFGRIGVCSKQKSHRQ